MTVHDLGASSSLTSSWIVRYPSIDSQTSVRSFARIITTGDARPPWVPQVKRRIQELAMLPDGWDPRGSRALSREDLDDALSFMVRMMREDTEAPWMGLLSSGGLQLAWTRDDLEVEAVFDRSRGERHLLVSVGPNEWEEPIESAWSLFNSVADRLSSRHSEGAVDSAV